MQALKYLALLATVALMMPFSAFARDKNEHSVAIPNPVQVGSTKIAAGNYKLDWQGTGPSVKVNFLRGTKIVATVPATLKTNDDAVTQDDVVTDMNSNKPATLKEIDFAHQKEALLFTQSGM
jgi:hypothetical protein